MEKLILPQYLLAELVPTSPCPGCGLSQRTVCFRFPRIKIDGNHDELLYYAHCAACGAYVPIHVRLPRLLLGFLLLKSAELLAQVPLGKSKTVQIVEARRDNALTEYIAEYQKLLRHTPGRDGLDNLREERIAFDMDEQTWGEFMSRLGLDGDTDESS